MNRKLVLRLVAFLATAFIEVVLLVVATPSLHRGFGAGGLPSPLALGKEHFMTLTTKSVVKLAPLASPCERFILPFGPAVIDYWIAPKPAMTTTDPKHDSSLRIKRGGAACNVADQVTSLGVAVQPIFLVGADRAGKQLAFDLRKAFPESLALPLLEETRRSFLVAPNGTCYTVRSSLKERAMELPAVVADRLAKASLTTIGPMTPADYPLLLKALSACPRAILQLSARQLADKEQATELARLAWLTIVNRAEQQLWIGAADPQEGIRRLQGRGVANVMVTHDGGVDAVIDGHSLRVPRPQANRVVRTIGAGDVVVGAFAALTVLGEAPETALRHAVAAAVLHVEGLRAGDRRMIAHVAANRPAERVQVVDTESARRRLGAMLAVAGGVSALAGLAWMATNDLLG